MATKALAQPITAEQIHALLRRARDGDQRAMDRLRPLLEAHPEMWRQLGELALQADRALIAVVAGKDELTKEALTRQLAALRAGLAGERPTPLERLLVERIGSCWLALAYAEASYAQQMGALGIEWGDYMQRRIDRCQRRYLSAIKALAVVRRLHLPAVQVNIGERQVNVAAGGPAAKGLLDADDEEGSHAS